VRCDSIRDLYAKALALLGLGLLAGVGALVDYWPVGWSTPQVAATALAAPARLAAGPALDVDIPVQLAEAPAQAIGVNALAVSVGAPPVPGHALEIPEPALPVLDAVPARVVALPVTELALDDPALPPGPDFDPAIVYQLGGAEDESGLLSDAVDMMKSTGSTLARGGAITGASIVGAFRVVSGAFKKLKFF